MRANPSIRPFPLVLPHLSCLLLVQENQRRSSAFPVLEEQEREQECEGDADLIHVADRIRDECQGNSFSFVILRACLS